MKMSAQISGMHNSKWLAWIIFLVVIYMCNFIVSFVITIIGLVIAHKIERGLMLNNDNVFGNLLI